VGIYYGGAQIMDDTPGRAVIDRYSQIFDASDDATATAMMWGFQTEPGWFTLLENLCDRLEPIAQDGFAIVCIKSKNATLRVHCRGGSEATEAEIEQATSLAHVTCELCGRRGERREVGGGLGVRCRACAG
jgi:hypothetical protein